MQDFQDGESVYFTQAGLELAGSSDPSTSASCKAGAMSVHHCAQQ